MDFKQKLDATASKNNSLLCVGLDPDMSKIPTAVAKSKTPLFDFNKSIIDATADLVCAFKPNSAMYEAHGAEGIAELKLTCDYILKSYPDVPVILDFKRADIGNTNQYYADFAFKYLGVDAITISPYMGKGAVDVFLGYKEKGIMILVRTSNPGSGEFQDLETDGQPLYQRVALNVLKEWNSNNNCQIVAGATYPDELKELRKLVGSEMIFLVPGVGAQGGDVESFVKSGIGANKRGLIINSSRQVIYASNGDDFAEAARTQAQKTRDEINRYR